MRSRPLHPSVADFLLSALWDRDQPFHEGLYGLSGPSTRRAKCLRTKRPESRTHTSESAKACHVSFYDQLRPVLDLNSVDVTERISRIDDRALPASKLVARLAILP